MSTHIITVEEDESGNAVITLPTEVTSGDNPWLEGDDVVWEIKGDNEVHLINKSWITRNKNGFK